MGRNLVHFVQLQARDVSRHRHRHSPAQLSPHSITSLPPKCPQSQQGSADLRPCATQAGLTQLSMFLQKELLENRLCLNTGDKVICSECTQRGLGMMSILHSK